MQKEETYKRALQIVEQPLNLGSCTNLPMIAILEESIRDVISQTLERASAEAAHGVERLAQLVRLAMDARAQGVYPHAVGFLKLRLQELEAYVRTSSGDPTGTGKRLGGVIGHALEVMHRADDETYRVPDLFRISPRPA